MRIKHILVASLYKLQDFEMYTKRLDLYGDKYGNCGETLNIFQIYLIKLRYIKGTIAERSLCLNKDWLFLPHSEIFIQPAQFSPEPFCLASVTLSVLVFISQDTCLIFFFPNQSHPILLILQHDSFYHGVCFLAPLFPRGGWIPAFIKIVWRVFQLWCLIKQTAMMKITKTTQPSAALLFY